MAEIQLVRQSGADIPEADREAARRVLFGQIDGLGEVNRKAWRRFMNGLFRLTPGEVVEVRTHRPRVGVFHRRHMKMEQTFFQQQERFQMFEQFRNWLKVGAGFCDWMPGPKGAVMPIPRSISYSSIGEDEMQAFHENVIEFMRTPHAQKVLWPHLDERRRDEMVETIIADPFAFDH